MSTLDWFNTRLLEPIGYISPVEFEAAYYQNKKSSGSHVILRRHVMADTVVEALILDLLEFLEARERSYEEVLEAWRTSCPKLPVWEDANDRGLVTLEERGGRCIVGVSPSGRALLARRKTAPR